MDLAYCYSECARVQKLVEGLKVPLWELYDEIRQNVKKITYGIGGETMPRGYYCPSLICDIVAGNVRRGRICHTVPTGTVPSAYYGFDGQNRLITIDRPFEKTCLIRDAAIERGFTLDGVGEIQSVSECVYSAAGQIQKYSEFLFLDPEQTVTEFSIEEYTYLEDVLTVDRYHFFHFDHLGPTDPNISQKPIIEHTRYIFKIADDRLRSYTVEKYCDGKRVPDIWDDRVFQVYAHRKIRNLRTDE